MAVIKLAGFSGEQPRITPRMLPDTAAQQAVNARLDDGALTPIRKPVFSDDIDDTDAQTIYRFGDDWLSWPDVVNAAPGPVDDTRLYYTGDGVPKMLKDGTEYALALAAPTGALTATLGGSGSGDVVTRIYTYTWVTDFGEESAPAAASNAIDWKPGNTVTLSGFGATPAGRNIARQRIYRSQTGQNGTGFYLIAERTAATSDFSDTVAVDAFQESLPSIGWDPPPDDLSGLIALDNGMMAAFTGRQLCFSEPWRPHAWPEAYRLTTDSDIVGLGYVGGVLFILTVAQPYLATGATPDTMQMQKTEANLPCVNARGIVDMGFALAYPSNDGIVLAYPSGQIGLATFDLFARDTWRKLGPSTLIGCQHQGRYAAFLAPPADGDAQVLLIALGEQQFLSRANARATAAFYDVERSALYYVPFGTAEVWRIDDPNGSRRDLYWRSKVFALSAASNFGAIRIDADAALDGDETALDAAYRQAVIDANAALLASGSVGGEVGALSVGEVPVGGDLLTPVPNPSGRISVGVYADGVRVATVERTNKAARLPSGFKARSWEIDVSGDLSVSQIVLATTMDEIKVA